MADPRVNDAPESTGSGAADGSSEASAPVQSGADATEPAVAEPTVVGDTAAAGPDPSAGADDPASADGDADVDADADVEADVDVAALSAKAQQADEYLELAQRTRAEFDNFRKRAAREAAAAQERGATKLALELLPAIDNLDRALAHAAAAPEPDNGDGSLVAGIKHVHADLIAALKRADITPYSPEGEPFDPQFHEAVAQQPFEGAQPGIVVEVYQRGYRRGENVLRPARVVVAG